MTNPVPDRPDEHDEPESEWVECPYCSGKGRLDAFAIEDSCDRCGGTGEILNPNLSDYEQACALHNRNRY